VRKSPGEFRLELLEDRVTPSAPAFPPGLVDGAAALHSEHAENLFIDWSSRANTAVLTFNLNYQFSQFAQVEIRIEIPVFPGSLFQSLNNGFNQPTNLFNNPTTQGALGGTTFDNDAAMTPAASLASPSSSSAPASQGNSLAHQPASNTPAIRTPFVLPQVTPTVVQNTTNPATTVQTNQVTNPGLAFAATPLRLPTTTASGASDALASESLRLFPLGSTALGASAVNPLAITNPVATPSPKLTPFPPSGGAGEQQPEEQPKPPAERDTGTEQTQDLFDLFEAGLSAAFLPNTSDEAANALALVGDYGETGPTSEVQLLILGVVAASSIGVAYRRNKAAESERELLEAASWLPRPLAQ
jgi:hypothetical protein